MTDPLFQIFHLAYSWNRPYTHRMEVNKTTGNSIRFRFAPDGRVWVNGLPQRSTVAVTGQAQQKAPIMGVLLKSNTTKNSTKALQKSSVSQQQQLARQQTLQNPQLLSVVIPPGVVSGQTLQLQTPTGQMVQVQVPPGMKAGQSFQIKLNPQPQRQATGLMIPQRKGYSSPYDKY